MKIHPPHKVYVSKSPIHGYGVFANERIYEGEVNRFFVITLH